MPAFDELQAASFDGVPFVVSRVTVKGGMRHHTHSYPHAPGGEHEKLGRDPYTIEMDASFSTETTFPLYENAWPNDISTLFDRFEQAVTGDLVVPTLGTIKAFAIDWSREHTARNRSGETARFTFKEDQDDVLLVSSVVSIQFVSLALLANAIIIEAAAVGLKTDIFDAILQAAALAQAAVDQAELYGDTLAAKVDQVTVACQTANNALSALNEPPHWRVMESVQNLGVASIKLNEDILKASNPLTVFTTVTRMTIQDVARSAYGDTSRAVEILKLNSIPDMDNIPAGTELRLYAT